MWQWDTKSDLIWQDDQLFSFFLYKRTQGLGKFYPRLFQITFRLNIGPVFYYPPYPITLLSFQRIFFTHPPLFLLHLTFLCLLIFPLIVFPFPLIFVYLPNYLLTLNIFLPIVSVNFSSSHVSCTVVHYIIFGDVLKRLFADERSMYFDIFGLIALNFLLFYNSFLLGKKACFASHFLMHELIVFRVGSCKKTFFVRNINI